MYRALPSGNTHQCVWSGREEKGREVVRVLSVLTAPREHDDLSLMTLFYYISIVEAGDVLYEGGTRMESRELAKAVVSWVDPHDVRRSVLHHDFAISYLLDRAVVFTLISSKEADVRHIFALLDRIKHAFRDPNRELHFETTLTSLLNKYDVDLDDNKKPAVIEIKSEMEDIPEVPQDDIQSLVPLDTLDSLETSVATLDSIINLPPAAASTLHWKMRYVFIAILVGCAAIILGLAAIVWIIDFHSRRSHAP